MCSAVSALSWWWGDWSGLLISLMLWARVCGSDLIDLGEVVWLSLRQLAFKPVQGRFYEFKGHRIRVLDDELLPQRWIALDDLATALDQPLPAVAFRRRNPQAVSDERDGVYVLDDLVLTWLREQRGDRAGRLALWIEREVWYPARGRRASYEERKRAPGPTPGAPEE